MRITVMAIAAGMVFLAGDLRNETQAANNDRVPPAPVGHRQPTARDVPTTTQDNSAEDAMKKMDQNLDRKVRSICRGC